MVCLLLFIIPLAIGEIITKNTLPLIRATSQEVFSLNLDEYFAGNNLKYSLNNTAIDASIDSPTKLSTAKLFPTNETEYQQETNMLLPTFTRFEEQYFYAYSQNTLWLYELNFGDVRPLSDTEIPCSENYTDCFIQQVEIDDALDHLLISMKAFNSSNVEETMHYEIWYADLKGLSIQDIFLVDDLATNNLTSHKFKVFNHTVYSISEVKDPLSGLKVGSIMTIDYSNHTEPQLIQLIYKYSNDKTVNPVDLHIDSDKRLLVADKDLGYIEFHIEDGILFEDRKFETQARYGRTNSVTIGKNSWGNSIILGTDSGTLELMDDSLEVYRFYPSIDIFGSKSSTSQAIISPDVNIILANNVSPVDSEKGEANSFLSILNKQSQYQQASTIISRSAETLVGPTFDRYAPFALLSDPYENSKYYYIRQDSTGLRQINVTLGNSALTGVLDDDVDEKVQLIVAEEFTNLTTTVDVTLAYIPDNDYAIFSKSDQNPKTGDNETITLYLQNDDTKFYLPVSDYFQGPNITYEVFYDPEQTPAHMILNNEPQGKYKIITSRNLNAIDVLTGHFVSEFWVAVATDMGIQLYFDNEATPLSYAGTVDLGEDWTPKSIAFDGDTMFVSAFNSEQNTAKLVIYALEYHGTSFEAILKSKIDADRPCKLYIASYNLICLDTSQIYLYSQNRGKWSLQAVLDEYNLIDQVWPANFIDLAFGDVNDQYYMYIASHSYNGDNSIGILDLSNVTDSSATYPYTMSIGIDPTIISLGENSHSLMVYTHDGNIEVLDKVNPAYPSFEKNLGGWTNDNATSVANTEQFAVVKTDSQLLVYDLNADVHSSLFFAYNAFSNMQVNTARYSSTSSQYLYTLHQMVLTKMKIGTMDLLTDPNSPQATYDKLDLHIPNTKYLTEDQYTFDVKVSAFNPEARLDHTISMDIRNYGEFVSYNDENTMVNTFNNYTLNVLWNEEVSIGLDDLMNGQNSQVYLNINGEFPYFNETDNNYPAVILPKTETSDSYIQPDDMQYLDHVAVVGNGENYAFVSTSTGRFLAFTLTDKPRGMILDQPHNATLVSNQGFRRKLQTSHAICNCMELLNNNSTAVEFVASCSYDVPMETTVADKNYTYVRTSYTLAYLNYNYKERSLKLLSNQEIPHLPSQVIVSTNPNIPEIYDIVIETGTGPNTSLGHYTLNGTFLAFYNQGIIDYQSLGLNRLSINAVALTYNYTALTMYIADAYSGIIILEQDEDQFHVANTMTMDNPIKALGIWTDNFQNQFLAIASELGDVTEYNITQSQIEPERISYFPRHNNVNHTYETIGPRISCSLQEQEYYAFAMISDTQLITRVINRNPTRALNTGVFVDIPISNKEGVTAGSVEFLNGYTITALGANPASMQSFFLRHQQLTIPELTPERYSSMLHNNNNQTNFTLSIIGDNGVFKFDTYSPNFTLIRDVKHVPKHDDSSSGGVPWWGWFLISIAILASITGLLLWVILYKKRQRARHARLRKNEPLIDREFVSI